MISGGKIGEQDLDLICLTDDPERAVQHVLEADQGCDFDFLARHGRVPEPEVR